jgi:hypothetical protein
VYRRQVEYEEEASSICPLHTRRTPIKTI